MSRRMDNKRKTTTIAVNGNRHTPGVADNRLVSQTSSDPIQSRLIGVNNLRPKCEQTFRLIISNVSSDSALVYEKQLWNDIKPFRHLKDSILMEYLIGFYVSLLESVVMNGRPKEPFVLYTNYSQLSSTTKLLIYNILIRIGDLNRYLSKTSTAETYYQRARKVDVLRGHAYNQLAINTPLSQHLKCIYYYCRASKSSVEPILIAETNLKVAVNRFDSDILKLVLKMGSNANEEQPILTYPQKGIDWFYLSVISIYSENFDIIFKPFLEFLITNCELISNKHSDNDNDLNFALMAFDVALDWISLKGIEKTYCEVYAKELKDVKTALKNCSEFMYECDNSENESEAESGCKPLFHDYVLRGFSPLNAIHKKFSFDSNETLVVESNRLFSRVIDKLDKLWTKSLKPKRIRNVALGSILEGETN